MSEIKEQFVTYEIALKLKELGFDERCLGYFDIQSKELWLNDLGKNIINLPEILLPAPLWQQAIDWFREKFHFHILIENVNVPEPKRWVYEINKLPAGVIILWNKDTSPTFGSYEEAREQAILKAIELCQKEK